MADWGGLKPRNYLAECRRATTENLRSRLAALCRTCAQSGAPGAAKLQRRIVKAELRRRGELNHEGHEEHEEKGPEMAKSRNPEGPRCVVPDCHRKGRDDLRGLCTACGADPELRKKHARPSRRGQRRKAKDEGRRRKGRGSKPGELPGPVPDPEPRSGLHVVHRPESVDVVTTPRRQTYEITMATFEIPLQCLTDPLAAQILLAGGRRIDELE